MQKAPIIEVAKHNFFLVDLFVVIIWCEHANPNTGGLHGLMVNYSFLSDLDIAFIFGPQPNIQILEVGPQNLNFGFGYFSVFQVYLTSE